MLEHQKIDGEIHRVDVPISFRLTGRLVPQKRPESDEWATFEEEFLEFQLSTYVLYRQNAVLLGDVISTGNTLPGATRRYATLTSSKCEMTSEHRKGLSQTLSREFAACMKDSLHTRLQAGIAAKFPSLSAEAKTEMATKMAIDIREVFRDRISENTEYRQAILDSTTKTHESEIAFQNTGPNSHDAFYLECESKIRWIYEWYIDQIDIVEACTRYEPERISFFSKSVIMKPSPEPIEVRKERLRPATPIPVAATAIDQKLGIILISKNCYDDLLQETRKVRPPAESTVSEHNNLTESLLGEHTLPAGSDQAIFLRNSVVFPLMLTSNNDCP